MDRPKNVAAIVGGSSLLGRELRDLLAGTPFQVKLIGSDESEAGMLAEAGGEPTVITSLDRENLSGALVAFLAGSPQSSRKAVDTVRGLKRAPVLIDLTSVLEDDPGSQLRAPMSEPASYAVPPGTTHVVAHPAAIVLSLFLVRLKGISPFRRVMAHVFEPASERGRRGLDELHQQTINLLAFQKLPKQVYDEQVSFNLLARYGSEAPEALETIGLRLERHLAALLSLNGNVPMPSLRVIQASVFHGHSISLWVEFESAPEVASLELALAAAHVDVRGAGLEPPNVVGVAGQDGISVGAIEADRNDSRALWFWIAADNVRIVAGNAVAVARSVPPRSGIARPQ